MVFFPPLDDPNEYDNDNGLPPLPGGMRCCRLTVVGCLVLDVPGPVLEVGRVDVVILNGVFVGRLAGRHHNFCGSGSGSGADDGDGGGRYL
jgi:hypothetical protein